MPAAIISNVTVATVKDSRFYLIPSVMLRAGGAMRRGMFTLRQRLCS